VRAIIGIGNPGLKYSFNRHNIGFLTIDFVARSLNLSFSHSKFDFDYLEGDFDFNKFLLIKPTTFVNNTGLAVKQLLDNFSLKIEDLLIIVDDINLSLFNFRLKKSGGDGGHNGLASIIYHLNSNNFPRLRIGIGSNFQKGSLSEYVLSNFSEEEFNQLKKIFPIFSDIIKSFIVGGYNTALTLYSKVKKEIKNNSNIN
jgi:PTH1 family peptidyl-tRNA hydrolase